MSTATGQPRFTESYARQKLARLQRCDSIKPVRPGDEEYVCANDQIALVGNPLRHDVEEIRLLQTMAGDWWPEVEVVPPRMPRR